MSDNPLFKSRKKEENENPPLVNKINSTMKSDKNFCKNFLATRKY